MKKILLLSVFSIFAVSCLTGSVIKFVPRDYDFFLVFRSSDENFVKLSSVPFFSSLLKDEGLGIENIVASMLENVKYTYRITPEVLYEALSKDVLYAAKGAKLDFVSLFSLDPNYYIEAFKNIGINSIVAFQTDKPADLLRLMAALTNLKLTTNGDTWVMIDTDVAIFARYHDGYLVLAGSRNALERAIGAYDRADDQLAYENDVINQLLATDGWFFGFFKGDSFSFNVPALNLGNTATRYVTVKGDVTGESLRITVNQFVTNINEFKRNMSSVTTMAGMPFIGNFAFSATASGPLDVAKSIISWFEGAQEEIKKIYDIVSSFLEVSTDRIYLTGSLYGEKILFAAIFPLGKDYDLKKLIQYGARDFGGEIRLPILNDYLAFFVQGRNLIMTNMAKSEYEKISVRRRLRDETAYQYLSKRFPNSDIMRIYVDLGNLFQSILGIKVQGKVLVSAYVTEGSVVYNAEVM